ncbi:MAG: MFS transporter, partial [Fimbriimonadaceae bacterium]
RDALISESADPDKRGAAFGFHRAMDTAGALLGVVVTLVLIKLLPTPSGSDVRTYQLIFALAVIPGAFSVWITFRVKEEPVKPNLGAKWSRAELSKLPRSYWIILLVSLVFGLANTSDAFLLLNAKGSGFSDYQTILAYALYNVAYAALAFPCGWLSDRLGRIPVIALGWLIYAVVYIGFGQAIGSMWLLFLGYGVYQGLAQGATKALIADHSPAESRGAAMGFFYMVAGGATLVGNIGAGLLYDHVSPAFMFSVCGGLALLATVLLVATRKMVR